MMLAAPAKFFSSVRAGLLGPTLDQTEVEGCNEILAACEGWPLGWTAYALATAYHETAHSMLPVKEFGGAAYLTRMYDVTGQRAAMARRMGNTTPGDGVRYCGRGYVQLTWKANYERAQRELGVPLVAHPDLAMEPRHAAAIMRQGMSQGWFTGKRLSDYLPAGAGTLEQFKAARRIINGTDKAAAIAGYAMAFQAALVAGGWSAKSKALA